jgi:predicted dehydrogenase
MVGLGFMGATHLAAFSKIPDVRVAAACTNSAKALAGDLSDIGGNLKQANGVYDFSAVRKYTDWRELVMDKELDAVDICLPTDLHAAVAIAAMAAGKHVLCEKPMALTMADCERMIAAAEEHKRVLMVAQVLRFWPEYLYLQDFGRRKEYGAIRSATFVRQCGLPDWSHWLPVEERSGGATMDLLIHDIDQALLLCGMPQKVAAKKLGDGDALTATLLYGGGPEVRIQGGWFAPGVPFSMSFQARAERAELELRPDGLMLSDAAGQRTKVDADGDGYEAEVGYFVDCCRKGTQPERCLPRESAQAVKVALLLKQSREMGGEQVKCSD